MRLAALAADLRVVDARTAKASEIGEYPAPYPLPPLARGERMGEKGRRK
jgi:hypothetical protein